MTAPNLARFAAAISAVSLVGCASTPPPPPPPPVAAAPKSAPAMVTMAPIANPEEPAPARRDTLRPRRTEPPAPTTHRAPAKPAPAVAPPASAPRPAPAAPSRDPARAAQLRARGLEQLNRGSAAQAVALLAQASRLDPENVLIRRDLERAERINRAVGGAH